MKKKEIVLQRMEMPTIVLPKKGGGITFFFPTKGMTFIRRKNLDGIHELQKIFLDTKKYRFLKIAL